MLTKEQRIKELRRKIDKQCKKVDNCISAAWCVICFTALLVPIAELMFGVSALSMGAIALFALIYLVVNVVVQSKKYDKLHQELFDLILGKMA